MGITRQRVGRYGWARVGLGTALAVLLAACGGGAAGGASNSSSAKLTPVTFRLNYTSEGESVPFAYGVDTGIYKAHGLDVTWEFGSGSANTTELVASGQVEIGLGDGIATAQLDAKGVPATMVMGYLQTNPLAAICSAKSGIKTPADLKGKSIGEVPGASSSLLLPAFLAKNGLTPSQVKIVSMAATAQQTALFAGNVDCILNYGYLIQPAMQQRGLSTTVLNFADSGLNSMNLGLIVTPSTISKDPTMVKEFVQATIASMKAAQKNPKAAVQDLINDSHGTAPTESVLMQEFLEQEKLYTTPADAGHPLGWMAQSDWSNTITLAQTYLKLSPAPPLSQLYTNQFV